MHSEHQGFQANINMICINVEVLRSVRKFQLLPVVARWLPLTDLPNDDCFVPGILSKKFADLDASEAMTPSGPLWIVAWPATVGRVMSYQQ